MYLALYRKYRPKKFADVVGQNHIVKTLLNQINSNHISHAYLFCGTRGTGKTSIAKIFAMSINCLNNKDGEPCMECESCKNVLNKQDPNIIEIDAASNNGVDNIREIRDEVKYPPINGKYKIYIIDEVHMLSAGAFNALLKTLEEPPSHVIFILATTDPQKIPATIHSRCQRFDFKRILPQEMFAAIKKYMDNENIKITDEAINYIIRMSDGAMRDALSILDQCISFYFGEEITLQKVTEIIGTVDDKICCDFVNLLCEKETEKVLNMINKIVMDGKDINQFLSTLILFLRDVVIYKGTGDLDSWVERQDIFRNLNLTFANGIKLLEDFSRLQNGLKYAINPKVLFEILCIKLCSNTQMQPENILMPTTIKKSAEKKVIHKKKAVPEDLQQIIKNWPKLVSKFDGLLKEILGLSCVGYLKGNIIYIITNDSGSNLILKQKKSDIKNIMSENLNFEFELDFMSKDEYDNEHKNIYGKADEELTKQLEKINAKIIIED